MPNVGWGEIAVILLIALIVFGPNKLPEMMRSAGKALRSFQEESSRAMEQLRAATEIEEPEGTDTGVIDRPDGFDAASEDAAAAATQSAPADGSSAPPAKRPARKKTARPATSARQPAKKAARPRAVKKTTTQSRAAGNGRSAARSIRLHEDT